MNDVEKFLLPSSLHVTEKFIEQKKKNAPSKQTTLDLFFKKKSTNPSMSACESVIMSTSDDVCESNASESYLENDYGCV